MQITMNNGCNDGYQTLFDDLIKEVFDFSFAPWFERNLWDERYESYAIIEDGKMLSNVSIFKMDMVVCGKTVRAHSFGAVATRKSERGKGLSKLLVSHVLNAYPEIPAFLSANPGVLNFYPRFGFRRVETYCPEIAVQINNVGIQALRLNLDDALIQKILNGHREYSDSLDSLNAQTVRIFHLLLDYKEGIYHLPGCDAILVAEQEGDRLLIADVITRAPVTFEAMKLELPFAGIRIVEFGFCPEWLGVSPDWKPIDMDTDEDPFFILGEWHFPLKYRFPIMSIT